MEYKQEIAFLRNLINLAESYRNDGDFDLEEYFDIVGLSDNELASLCTDLSIYVEGRSFDDKVQIINEEIIVETENRSYPFEEVKSILSDKLKLQPYQFAEANGAHGISLIVLYADIGQNMEILIGEMMSLGWSKSHVSGMKIINGMRLAAIQFDPIYQTNANDDARSFDVLYHWTPFSNVDSINSHGLLPKSDNLRFSYLPHVHLIYGDVTQQQMKRLVQLLYSTNPQSDGHYALYEIVTAKVSEGIDFFYDVRCEKGFYTNQPIPPQAIKLIRDIYLNKDKPFDKSVEINIF